MNQITPEPTVIRGMDLMFLEVNNLEESLLFYRDVMGFTVEKYTTDSDPPMATIRAGQLKITLAQHLETMLRRGRGVSFFYTVDDVDDYYRGLQSRGAAVSAPTDEGWGGRFVTLEDPDKYRLFVVEWQKSED